MQRLEGPRTTAGISKGRGRAGAARKLIGMEWAQEGKGELQKLKAEGLPCSRPCPDLGWLPLTRSPGRGWDRRQAAQTERSQQRPTLPQGPCLTETRVEGINTPEHFLCARLCAWPWDHTSSMCEVLTVCQVLTGLGSFQCRVLRMTHGGSTAISLDLHTTKATSRK